MAIRHVVTLGFLAGGAPFLPTLGFGSSAEAPPAPSVGLDGAPGPIYGIRGDHRYKAKEPEPEPEEDPRMKDPLHRSRMAGLEAARAAVKARKELEAEQKKLSEMATQIGAEEAVMRTRENLKNELRYQNERKQALLRKLRKV